jgi:hypothetical protein
LLSQFKPSLGDDEQTDLFGELFGTFSRLEGSGRKVSIVFGSEYFFSSGTCATKCMDDVRTEM